MLELQLEGLRGVHWQCIVPTGVQAGQRFNVRLAGLQGRLAQQAAAAADSPAGRPGSDEDPQASVTRVPRPPESDLWRTAWSQRYKRWYWWNTDTLATSWSRPRIWMQQNNRNVASHGNRVPCVPLHEVMAERRIYSSGVSEMYCSYSRPRLTAHRTEESLCSCCSCCSSSPASGCLRSDLLVPPEHSS